MLNFLSETLMLPDAGMPVSEAIKTHNALWESLTDDAKRFVEDALEYNPYLSVYGLMKETWSANVPARPLGAEGYKRLAGEVEARNVEKRLDMTMAERLASLAEETEDVAREDQIILREGAEMAMAESKKKSANETVSPNNSDHPAAISSADGAKILKNIDNLAKKYQEKSNRPDTFIGDVADALGIDMPNKSSKYRTYETISGDIVTIRLSNHGATASKLDSNNETNAVSIVIANSYDGITNDGEAHIVEYFYDAIKLRKADGKPLVGIINSLKQTLYSGKYVDNTGIAEVKEVNAKFSLITPEMDASYLDAVERGDMETAQRMVLEAARKEIYKERYKDAEAVDVINELVCFMVGYLEIAKTKPTFEGEISTQQHADAWRADIESSKVSEQTKAVLYEILPLVKENLDYQKEQYGAEKEHTIVIPRREYDGSNVGRDKKRSTLWGDKKYSPKEAQLRNATDDRRGESADAQEVDFNIISSVYDKREDS